MPSKNQGYQKVATDLVVEQMPATMETDPVVESGGGLPSTHSSQQLMPKEDAESNENIGKTNRSNNSFSSISRKEWFTVGVLCFVNLINYMDRFTIAGVLDDIQEHYSIGDDRGGLLQTAFVLSYMICAPIFGYFGDRYSRRWIMALGVALWSATTLLGSYMNEYGWFLTFRALVGIGEASYSTIAPTIISDLFVSDLRSKMLAMFYFAIPVGSGLGYIVGSETAKWLGSWQYALRVTPILGVIAVILIFLIKEPERGHSEGSNGMQTTSYTQDLVAIAKNGSFMLSTLGFTCVAFVAGALSWWGPKFIYLGMKMQPGNDSITLNKVSFIFGALTMTSGIIGVPLGSFLSQALIKRYPRIDPIICAIGLIVSAPFLGGAIILVSANSIATYTLIFLGELALNLNWAIVADILLYVVVPTRRSSAEAFQILISHAFGDAGSPYLVGVISEALKSIFRLTQNGLSDIKVNYNTTELVNNFTTITTLAPQMEDSIETKFKALQYALFTTCFVEVLGGIFFLATAFYIIKDKANVDRAIAGCQLELSESSSSSDSNVDRSTP